MSTFESIILQSIYEGFSDDSRDTVAGYGNYYTSRGKPTLTSKKIVDTIISKIKKIKSKTDISNLALDYKDISDGESQAVLNITLKSSNLKYNTVFNIRHAPENAAPSEALIGKILKDLGPHAYSNWVEFKELFITNSQYSMALCCLLLSGLIFLYDR